MRGYKWCPSSSGKALDLLAVAVPHVSGEEQTGFSVRALPFSHL